MSKKEIKVRTSITVDPDVLTAVRVHCANSSLSVSSYIEDVLTKALPPSAFPVKVTPEAT